MSLDHKVAYVMEMDWLTLAFSLGHLGHLGDVRHVLVPQVQVVHIWSQSELQQPQMFTLSNSLAFRLRLHPGCMSRLPGSAGSSPFPVPKALLVEKFLKKKRLGR